MTDFHCQDYLEKVLREKTYLQAELGRLSNQCNSLQEQYFHEMEDRYWVVKKVRNYLDSQIKYITGSRGLPRADYHYQ